MTALTAPIIALLLLTSLMSGVVCAGILGSQVSEEGTSYAAAVDSTESQACDFEFDDIGVSTSYACIVQHNVLSLYKAQPLRIFSNFVHKTQARAPPAFS